jgi:hypothetical protein
MNLCEYRNIFGEPKTGVHSIRFFGIAFVDFVVTLAVAYLIHLGTAYSFWKVAAVLIAVGVVAHRLFCVRTPLTKLVFNY